MQEYISIPKFAKLAKVSSSAVYLAIKRGSINSIKSGKRSFINIKFLEYYKNGKISKEYACINGNRVWNKDKGILSIRMISNMLNISYNRIYFLVITGKIPSKKIGGSWAIDLKDVMEYFQIDGSGNKKIV